MSSVSSGDNRGASPIVCNSPPIRMTGNEPTFKCRSEAKWAVAVTSRSSILTAILHRSPEVVFRGLIVPVEKLLPAKCVLTMFREGFGQEPKETRRLSKANRTYHNEAGEQPSTFFVRWWRV